MISVRIQKKPSIGVRVLPRLIPKDGAAASIAVGSVATLPPGSQVTVTNSGTSAAAVLDFAIPQGAQGDPGDMSSSVYDPQGKHADAFARANHTGTQLAATISDFSTAADARISAAIGSTVQGYSAALASWAGVSRASGFDAFVASPTSANLRALLTDEVGTGAAYFIGGALGTPASANLSNATSLPVSGITSSTTQALGVGSLEVGHASDTTISRSAAGVIAVEGVPLYPNIPQNSQSAAYTTVLADAQKHILHPAADNNARTFTIAANASVAYPIGTAISFVNEINTVTIAINSDTLTLAGSGSTGSRTLAANGQATALKTGATKWVISGTGLT